MAAQWNQYTTYAIGDVVAYIGQEYSATVANINTPPFPATPTWALITPPLPPGAVTNPLTASLDCATFDVFNGTTFNSTTVECDTIDPKPGSLATFIDVNQSLRVAGAGNDLESDNDVLGRVGTVTQSSLNDVFDRAAGIVSYDPLQKLTIFNTAPLVPTSGVEVVGSVSASADVVASYGVNNYSLITVASEYNIVGGFYKTANQSAPTGNTDITWDASYGWGDSLPYFSITPGGTAITCNVHGVYEIAAHLFNLTGTSTAAATNSRGLSFDLTRAPNPRINGFVNSNSLNLGSGNYNQITQGVVELLVGDILHVRLAQVLTGGSSIIDATVGNDPNTWMTYKLYKRLP